MTELQKIVMLTQHELEALTEVLSHVKFRATDFDILYSAYRKLVDVRNQGTRDERRPS